MSQRDLDNKLNRIHSDIKQVNEFINRLGSSLETYKLENKFWIRMISRKIFSETELIEIKNVERLWYKLAVSMPNTQPLNMDELKLLAEYELIDGAQMANMASRIDK